jgi:hypothetical protein
MPGIFISYRREDTPGHAGRLYDALNRRFGEEQVFMDLDMEPGVDFVREINEAVGSCRLLIAVIGPRWTNAQSARGQRRLDDATDFIRIEIEAGLRRPDVRVVPLLVQGARMPTAEELPPSLADLARRNALELSDARWDYDVGRLTSTVERVLAVQDRPSGVVEPMELPDTAAKTAGLGGPPNRSRSDSLGDEYSPRRSARARWLRRHWRLAILSALVIAVALVAVIVSNSGNNVSRTGNNARPQTQTQEPLRPALPPPTLRAAVPASVRNDCDRDSSDQWMRQYRNADKQISCPWKHGAYLTYGSWSSSRKARTAMPGFKQDSKDCTTTTSNDVKAYYASRGDARCLIRSDNSDVVMWWNDNNSPVIGWFEAPTKDQAAAFTDWQKVFESG